MQTTLGRRHLPSNNLNRLSSLDDDKVVSLREGRWLSTAERGGSRPPAGLFASAMLLLPFISYLTSR